MKHINVVKHINVAILSASEVLPKGKTLEAASLADVTYTGKNKGVMESSIVIVRENRKNMPQAHQLKVVKDDLGYLVGGAFYRYTEAVSIITEKASSTNLSVGIGEF